jgi:Spy/CpxP family protein refolding chaperone
MKRIGWLLLLAVGPALAAQNPPDTSRGGRWGRGAEGGAQAEQLRQEVRERWRVRVRKELNLTDDQAAKLHASEDRFFERRRDIMQRQRAVFEGLRGQLQPGVAANSDSVRKLMDARDQNRGAMLQLDRDEDKETAGYLSPVQRARYQLMRQRLQERIAEMRRERGGPMRGPGGEMMGPRGERRPPGR